MNNIKNLFIFPLLLTYSLHGMDNHQDEHKQDVNLGAGFIDVALLTKVIATELAKTRASDSELINKEIKISGTSTATSFSFFPNRDTINPDKTWENYPDPEKLYRSEQVRKKIPTQWQHDYTISFVDKDKPKAPIVPIATQDGLFIPASALDAFKPNPAVDHLVLSSDESAPASGDAFFAYRRLNSDSSDSEESPRPKVTKHKSKKTNKPRRLDTKKASSSSHSSGDGYPEPDSEDVTR